MLKDINVTLPCGHVIKDMRCHVFQAQDSFKCEVIVEKTISKCSHTAKVACHVDVNSDQYFCHSICEGLLGCGHSCKFFASRTHIYKSNDSRIGKLPCYHCYMHYRGKHGKCVQKCERNYSNCSHKCEATCHPGQDCGLCKKPCEVACIHSRCDRVCSEPCTPCAQADCPSSCPHSKW